MEKAKTQHFYDYVMETYYDEDHVPGNPAYMATPEADFATDTYDMRERFPNTDDRQTLRKWLSENRACSEAIATFNELYDEWIVVMEYRLNKANWNKI